jgi:hypothetical protein
MAFYSLASARVLLGLALATAMVSGIAIPFASVQADEPSISPICFDPIIPPPCNGINPSARHPVTSNVFYS